MKRIYSYIPSKSKVILGFILKLIEVVLELFLPFFMASLMKDGFLVPTKDNAYLMVVLILIFSIVGYMFTILSHKLISSCASGFSLNLRNNMFFKLIYSDFSEFNNLSKESLTSRLNTDVNNLQNALAMSLRISSRAPVLIIGSIIFLFTINVQLASLLLIFIPALIILLTFILYFSVKIYSKYLKANDKQLTYVKEAVYGYHTIKGFNKEEDYLNSYKKDNVALEKVLTIFGKISSITNPLTVLVTNIMLVLLILIGAHLINDWQLSNEKIVLLVNYTTSLSLAILAVMNMFLLYVKAFSSKNRVLEVLNLKEKQQLGTNELDYSKGIKIEFKNVSYSHNKKHNILENVSFIIDYNESINIIGLTSSGKTTILKLILGYYTDYSGDIIINDTNLKEIDLEVFLSNVAYVDQTASVLNDTVYKNVTMGNSISDEELESNIIKSSSEFINAKPNKLNEVITINGSNLSGGQRKRIALLRAINKNTNLILLDDVYSALDNKTGQKIRNEFKKNLNTTIVNVSSRITTISDEENVLLINHKKVISGTHKELYANNTLYKELYDSQRGDN